jgi:putative Mg2+ transporter-C (MgtC) family protein
MSLVSMGAAVFTICGTYGFANFPKVDASRMAANVASGVGFVGAGVITTSMRRQDKRNPNIPQNNIVHGLTTAATIWISAAVGVSCGVGLLRVATTAVFVTIFILRMGRKRKNDFSFSDYHALQRRQQQRHRSAMLREDGGNPDVVDSDGYVDDHGDVNAEIHVTTHWNEHLDHEPDELQNNSSFPHTSFLDDRSRFTSQNLQEQMEIEGGKRNQLHLIDKHNTTVIYDNLKDQSELMEEIVRSAWKNNNKTVDSLVDMVLNRVEQRDRVLKHSPNAREDHPSSSKSEFLP